MGHGFCSTGVGQCMLLGLYYRYYYHSIIIIIVIIINILLFLGLYYRYYHSLSKCPKTINFISDFKVEPRSIVYLITTTQFLPHWIDKTSNLGEICTRITHKTSNLYYVFPMRKHVTHHLYISILFIEYAVLYLQT